MARVRTTCPYCGVGCGVIATPSGEREVQISGDEGHPANLGLLCSKGTHLGETIGLEGRLLEPMIGEQPAEWDTALDLVASRFAAAIAEHGPNSVAFYVSGQLLTEDYYAANKLMKGFIGSANIDTNSRLCMASAVAAHVRAFGEDLVPGCYDDLDEADLIILVGSNTAWCHPVIWQRIEAARAGRGTKLVVIDPRRTETAEGADLFLPIRPDSDVALFNGLLAHMVSSGRADLERVERESQVPPGFWEALAAYDCKSVARLCDLDEAAVGDFYALFADIPRTVTLFSQGVNQSVQGTDKANAIINLHLATGRIGVAGAAPFSITGQPNAMGGREVGGLASTLAAHMDFAPSNVDRARRFWNSSTVASKPGLKAVDLFEAVGDGRIKALWIMATNPAVSMPDAGSVRAALAACPFVVVSDVVVDTDTSRFAHVRLPASGWAEKEGTVTNSERRISRQRAFFAAPGQARPDWWIITQVAKRLGYGGSFPWESPAAIFREYCAMTGFENEGARRLNLGALAQISDSEYEAMEPIQWGGARLAFAPGETRLVRVDQSGPDPAPMILNTGRYRDQWHTMTRSGLSPRLSQHRREPLIEISSSDAAAADVADDDLARVGTAQGNSIFRVKISNAQRVGEIFAPIHWTDMNCASGRTGLLPGQAVDPFSGQPGFKRTPVTLAKVATEWRAFLIARELPRTPACLWWTKVRAANGWLFELAGNEGLDRLEALLPDGKRAELVDAARGNKRIAITSHGRLLAALFVSRDGALPSREWLIDQLDSDDPRPAIGFLAARPAGAVEDQGEVVCVCFNVGAKKILKAIRKDRLTTIAEVGSALNAGTNCGSCRPAIARLLAERSLVHAAG